jgi:DNA-binding NarL/FixJ family response regulator
MIRVLVADDSPAFRFGLRTMLQAATGMEVIGEAASGDEAVVRAAREHPDVVVMDLAMAGPEDGVEATARIVEQSPHVGVLVLTMSAADATLGRALRAGARGYLVKGAPRAEVERAVRTVADGGLVLGALLAARAAALLGPPTAADPVAGLSTREREVLHLLAENLDNASFAARLSLSQKTVRNVVSSVFAKLGCSDRAEVGRMARRQGFGGTS